MNWFRLIGGIVSLAGVGTFLLGIWRSIPRTNESAAIGVIDITGLFFGAVLIVAGLSIAIIGGRSQKLQ